MANLRLAGLIRRVQRRTGRYGRPEQGSQSGLGDFASRAKRMTCGSRCPMRTSRRGGVRRAGRRRFESRAWLRHLLGHRGDRGSDVLPLLALDTDVARLVEDDVAVLGRFDREVHWAIEGDQFNVRPNGLSRRFASRGKVRS